ncbi:MAG: hypothetical protein HOA02_04700, partial [Planctomycetes bacterium]|nr:hypothetical protein [Planctomycetota bacterium]
GIGALILGKGWTGWSLAIAVVGGVLVARFLPRLLRQDDPPEGDGTTGG